MSFVVRVEPMSRLAEHASIPIALLVERIFEISGPGKGLAGTGLTEVAVKRPWEKDYDAITGGSPTLWLTRFDTKNWGLIAAYDGADRVGGAVIAFNTPGVNMLEGEADAAVLWDLRVHPNVRRSGVGTMLFHAVEDWSRQRECLALRIETQSINVPACRFYARMGCSLDAVNQLAYPDLPDEVQLIWKKELCPAVAASIHRPLAHSG